jgi:hypothetical protein
LHGCFILAAVAASALHGCFVLAAVAASTKKYFDPFLMVLFIG